MICPSAAASAIRSASSGVTSSVTTVDGIGLPSLRASPGRSLRAGGQHLHVADDDARHALAAVLPRTMTSTSTRVPGTTKPATPMTSLTFTEIARMPGGNRRRQAGAGLDRRELALRQRLVLEHGARSRPRSTTSSIFVEAAGQRVARRPGHELDVVLREQRAQRQLALGDDDRGVVRDRDLAHRDSSRPRDRRRSWRRRATTTATATTRAVRVLRFMSSPLRACRTETHVSAAQFRDASRDAVSGIVAVNCRRTSRAIGPRNCNIRVASPSPSTDADRRRRPPRDDRVSASTAGSTGGR